MSSPVHASPHRRLIIRSFGLAAGSVLLLSACAKEKEESGEKEGQEGEEEVSATEDLMREHGVLRRLLVVYRESAIQLRTSAAAFNAGALAEASDLFRTFGEDYHEKELEEQHVFPSVRRLQGEAASLVDALQAQHDRGREINAWIKSKCASGSISDAEPVARALESFARMYEAHAAYEDTIVFQAWKSSMSPEQLHETGEQFEEIEHRQFSGDGFDIALAQVAAIEEKLKLHSLEAFTAAAAPA